MTRLAFSECEAYKSGRLEVSDFEIKREGRSYTVYTLEHFFEPWRELYLLMGTDMFLSLDRWYRAEDIFALADIVLMRRERDDGNTVIIEKKMREYRERYSARLHTVGEEPIVISSTELREGIDAGTVPDGLIPESVARYIRENNLYR